MTDLLHARTTPTVEYTYHDAILTQPTQFHDEFVDCKVTLPAGTEVLVYGPDPVVYTEDGQLGWYIEPANDHDLFAFVPGTTLFVKNDRRAAWRKTAGTADPTAWLPPTAVAL